MNWTVDCRHIQQWLQQLDSGSRFSVAAALRALEIDGPLLGRPFVDSIKGSSIHNLKELRPRNTGRSEIRILFVFDPQRKAIMLLGGDKSGVLGGKRRWAKWYDWAIPRAERIYSEYMEGQDERG